MKLSEHVKISPASVPVGKIPFRGSQLDIFAPTGEDLCWLLAQSGSIQGSLDKADDGFGAILQAIAVSGPHVLRRLLSIATGMPEEDLPSAKLILAEQEVILKALFEMGVPDGMRGKIMAILGAWLTGVAAKMSKQAEAESTEASSTPSPTSLKSSKPTEKTPTA